MWLGEVLTELGWQTVPALHCRQALALSKRLQLPIKTLLLDPDLPGAARAIKTLVTANPGLRVVLIRDSPAQPACGKPILACREAILGRREAILERPAPWQSISRPEWIDKVRRVLTAG
jgi:hypothetical protein